MKVKIYIDRDSEMRFMHNNTQCKNTLTNYTKYDILAKRLVLLSAAWDGNGLLFTKGLHMMNEIIVYSYARTLMESIQLCGIF